MALDAYTDLDTFRQYLRAAAVLDEADDPDSNIEALALETAARAIDLSCNRDFRVKGAATNRYFTPTTSTGTPYGWEDNPTMRQYILPIDDVADVTGMTVHFDVTGNGDYTGTTTSYRVGPLNAPARGVPYTQLIFNPGVYPPLWEESVEVNVAWGWNAIPSVIVNANLLQAGRFIKRRDALFGVAGSPDMGNMVRLLSKLDPDVAIMVAVLKRNWGAA
jgi:hypothetical protein